MTNKTNFFIVQSKKGTEIVLSGRKINKQAWIATIIMLVAGIALFKMIHGKGLKSIFLPTFKVVLAIKSFSAMYVERLLLYSIAKHSFSTRSASFLLLL